MNLLKNNVGRPSKDTLRKRKIFYVTIASLVIALVGATGFISYNYITGINATEKNASSTTCRMPYTTGKCRSTKNSTIKKVQKMLNKLGYFKKRWGFNGYFGEKTVTAVKDFQQDYGLDVDGYIGPETLEELAKATDTAYFKIKYNKNGGSGTLNSQHKDFQTIIRGISTPISSTKLAKNGQNHVGYTASTTINNIEYKYGCFNKNCVSGKQKRYSVSAIQKKVKNGGTFYDYVFEVGGNVKNAGPDGATLVFTAHYCDAGKTYKKSESRCIKTSSSSSYNITGKLTGYNGFCTGCSGLTYCKAANGKEYDVRKNLYYNDSEYGSVRIVAMNVSKYPCGTIIEIQKLKDGSTQNNIRAIVLDKGGAITGDKIDLLSLKSTDKIYKEIGSQTVNYKVLRKGW